MDLYQLDSEFTPLVFTA